MSRSAAKTSSYHQGEYWSPQSLVGKLLYSTSPTTVTARLLVIETRRFIFNQESVHIKSFRQSLFSLPFSISFLQLHNSIFACHHAQQRKTNSNHRCKCFAPWILVRDPCIRPLQWLHTRNMPIRYQTLLFFYNHLSKSHVRGCGRRPVWQLRARTLGGQADEKLTCFQ